MAWYRAGSVTVTNGSAVVTGAGTDFVANSSVGEAFLGPDGRTYEISQVVSATQIVLGTGYQGASAGGQGFAVLPTQSFARDLALGAAQLLNTFANVRDGIGAGLFPDGSAATPGLRFASDQDTGMRRAAENVLSLVTGGVSRLALSATYAQFSTSALFGQSDQNLGTVIASGALTAIPTNNVTGIVSALDSSSGFIAGSMLIQPRSGVGAGTIITAEGKAAFIVSGAGNVGVGNTTPSTRLHVTTNYSSALNCGLRLSGAIPGVSFDAGNVTANSRNFSLINNYSAPGLLQIMYGASAGAEPATSLAAFDGISGNMLVGVTSGAVHIIAKSVAEGAGILTVYSPTPGLQTAAFFSVGAHGYSGAASAINVGRNTATGRSINAGGTINASGADYAEYMQKAAGCGRIGKGDICGVDREGRLTKTWADAVSYVVKSTDPSLVGGDTWDADVGPKPEAPGAEPVHPAMPTMPGDDASEDERAAWDSAVADHPAQLVAYQHAHAEWLAATEAHAEALTAWEAAHETARQCVDRIAFCGQVPVNVSGDFAVGDYIIAAANGAGIQAIAIADAEITFDQYRRRIGKVWALRDGRAWVDVQHG